MSFELRLHNISKSVVLSDNIQQHLFHPFSAVITSGSRIACIGASGQGKSSLLKILSRLELPATGSLYWNNVDANSIEVTSWRAMFIMLPSMQ